MNIFIYFRALVLCACITLAISVTAQQSNVVEKSVASLKKQFHNERYKMFGESDISLDEAIRKHLLSCQNDSIDEVCVTVTSSKKRLLPMLLLARAAQQYAMQQQITIKSEVKQCLSLNHSDTTSSEVERYTNEVKAYAENLYKEELTLSFIVYRMIKTKQSDGTESEAIEAMGFYLINSNNVRDGIINSIEQYMSE